MVACPYTPDNVHPVTRGHARRHPVDQVFIGSCTNGCIDDLRIVAELLRGHTIHPDIRCIIIPGSRGVQRQALREGLLEIFQDAEARRLHAGLRPLPRRLAWACSALASARLHQQPQLPRPHGPPRR